MFVMLKLFCKSYSEQRLYRSITDTPLALYFWTKCLVYSCIPMLTNKILLLANHFGRQSFLGLFNSLSENKNTYLV